MRNFLLLFGLLSTISTWAGTENFDKIKVGKLPRHWDATQTGPGKAAWAVDKDPAAPSAPNVLVQTGEAQFPICIKQDVKMDGGFIEVKLKPISGKEDQAGGIIWRCRDKDNYYIARANALENNIMFFHTIKGHRESIKSVNVTVTGKEWHTLRVEFQGPHVVILFDGKQVIEADDSAITGPGMIGLWTKADSVTAFDNFSYGEKK